MRQIVKACDAREQDSMVQVANGRAMSVADLSRRTLGAISSLRYGTHEMSSASLAVHEACAAALGCEVRDRPEAPRSPFEKFQQLDRPLAPPTRIQRS